MCALALRGAGIELRLYDIDPDQAEARAREHQDTIMIGRSHGIHAEPTTFGLKLLVYWSALERGLRRLDLAQEACRQLAGDTLPAQETV